MIYLPTKFEKLGSVSYLLLLPNGKLIHHVAILIIQKKSDLRDAYIYILILRIFLVKIIVLRLCILFTACFMEMKKLCIK
jgi:hypothetical protein